MHMFKLKNNRWNRNFHTVHGVKKCCQPKEINTKGRPPVLRTTTACWLRAEDRPSTQIAKVFCGKAFVSVHLRPVSTHSLRSFGHSPQAHGTQAQYKLATSTCLNVVCQGRPKKKKTEERAIK
jgi:hypothetical protein